MARSTGIAQLMVPCAVSDGMRTSSAEPVPWQKGIDERNAAGVTRGDGHRTARGLAKGLPGQCSGPQPARTTTASEKGRMGRRPEAGELFPVLLRVTSTREKWDFITEDDPAVLITIA